jgi:polyferredoxin
MQFSRFFSTRLLVLCLALSAAPAFGAGIEATYPQVRGFFPQADRFGDVAGEPPAAAVYRGKDLLGYVFLTFDVVRIPAYSGRPINTLVGFDLSGRITGVQIVGHEEPILLAGISENQLQRFVAQYRDKGVFDRISVGGTRAGHVTIDTISGATITVMVENATLMQSVRRVALARGLDPARLDAPNATRTTVTAKTAPAEPIWIGVWQERVFSTVVLGAGLVFLTLVLIFQDWLARHPKLLLYVRDGFLLYTLFFIGWYGLAQLSVVNVLTFSQALTHGFQWESFLIDPMMFILWAFVAATLLLWGRGVYCGWLCPFGALQELTFQLARRFTKLPFFEMPQAVHERLWALKYIILLALFGISLQSLSQAERLAEVEPFKTAITLRFQREWGFVLFAAAMVLISAFNRKFYCKYLCALGAALTIPGKFRIFDWLRRHRECGRPCQVCATECEVQAIRKNGEINANECHYCMDCQVTYWNTHKCPPMVERRRRREKGARARELVRGMETMLGPSGLEEVPARGEPAPREGRDPSGCAGCKYLSDK